MSFYKDLAYSYQDKILNAYYKHKGFKYIQVVTDLETQKKGIDKLLYYCKGESVDIVTIDEKKRRTTYDDLLVETMKNVEMNKKGWLYYTQANYIVYWIEPLNKIYIIKFKILQDLIFQNDWVNTKPIKTTYINRIYRTDNILLTWFEIESAITNIISYRIDKTNNKIYFKEEKFITNPF